MSKYPPYSAADFRSALAAAEAIHLPAPDVQQKSSVGAASITGLPGPPDMTQGYSDDHRTRELTRRAGWCLGPAGNITEAKTLEACLAWNRHNKPPLSDVKVRKTVVSIAKAETKKRAATSNTLFHTDLGNARRLVERHGENIRFIPEWQKWIVW
jgi:hypothetical protein